MKLNLVLEKLDSDSENAKKKQSKLQELERKKRRLRNEGVNLHVCMKLS